MARKYGMYFEYLAMRVDEGALSYEEVLSHLKKNREEKIKSFNDELIKRDREDLIPEQYKDIRTIKAEEKTEEKEVSEN